MNEQVKNVASEEDKKSSEGYTQARTNSKREGKIFKPIVYICSPYAGDVEKNTRAAKLYSRFAILEKNAIAFAPHLLLPQYLSENDPDQRELALFMDLVFLGKCNELWVFGEKITTGMQREIDKAKRRHMPIRYFTEALEEVTTCN